jgi:hypothetical protein
MALSGKLAVPGDDARSSVPIAVRSRLAKESTAAHERIATRIAA